MPLTTHGGIGRKHDPQGYGCPFAGPFPIYACRLQMVIDPHDDDIPMHGSNMLLTLATFASFLDRPKMAHFQGI